MCLPLINLINNFEPFSVRIITNHFVVFMIMRLSIHHAAAGVHHGNNSNGPNIYSLSNVCTIIKYQTQWVAGRRTHVFCNSSARRIDLRTFVLFSEPTTEILGGPELFIDQGSTINLTCLVQFAPEPPPTVGWTHEKQVSGTIYVLFSTTLTKKNGPFRIWFSKWYVLLHVFFFVCACVCGSQPINFDSPRGGISLVTEKGSTTSSRLLIQKASSSDTGYYSCDPSNANSATVRVHILNGWLP